MRKVDPSRRIHATWKKFQVNLWLMLNCMWAVTQETPRHFLISSYQNIKGKPRHSFYNKQQRHEASGAASCLTTKPQFVRLSRRSTASISCKSETPTRNAGTPAQDGWLQGVFFKLNTNGFTQRLEKLRQHLRRQKHNWMSERKPPTTSLYVGKEHFLE